MHFVSNRLFKLSVLSTGLPFDLSNLFFVPFLLCDTICHEKGYLIVSFFAVHSNYREKTQVPKHSVAGEFHAVSFINYTLRSISIFKETTFAMSPGWGIWQYFSSTKTRFLYKYAGCTEGYKEKVKNSRQCPGKDEQTWNWLSLIATVSSRALGLLPLASVVNSSRAFSYSCSSMVTITSTPSPPVSSLISSVTNKASRRAFNVPFLYIRHKLSRATRFSAWTLRFTLPSAICISLTPAGRTQVFTAETSWSYVELRLRSSKAEAMTIPPAIPLKTVLIFKTTQKD